MKKLAITKKQIAKRVKEAAVKNAKLTPFKPKKPGNKYVSKKTTKKA